MGTGWQSNHPQRWPIDALGALRNLLEMRCRKCPESPRKPGELALDAGLTATIGEELGKMKGMEATVKTHPGATFAGAIGAALWGAFGYDKLADLGQLPMAS